MLIISETAKVSPIADIEDSVRGSKIIVKANAVIDSFVKIKPAGGMGDFELGENSVINACTVIYTGNGILIGKNVLIAGNCTLAPTNHEYRSRDKLIREQGFMPSKGGIIIEDDVWIGANTVLLDGAIVRQGAVVAAGSVVRGELEAYSVYAGKPLEKIGSRK